MSPFSLSTWVRSLGWSSKYQVWHINQNPTIDRQIMVMVSGQKSANWRICPWLQMGKCRLVCWGVAMLWTRWNFFWEVPTLYSIYLDLKKVSGSGVHIDVQNSTKSGGINEVFKYTCWLVTLGTRGYVSWHSYRRSFMSTKLRMRWRFVGNKNVWQIIIIFFHFIRSMGGCCLVFRTLTQCSFMWCPTYSGLASLTALSRIWRSLSHWLTLFFFLSVF